MFVFWLLNYKHSSYILNTRPLSNIWFINILSNYLGYHFTFLIMSFFCTKIFKFSEVFSEHGENGIHCISCLKLSNNSFCYKCNLSSMNYCSWLYGHKYNCSIILNFSWLQSMYFFQANISRIPPKSFQTVTMFPALTLCKFSHL